MICEINAIPILTGLANLSDLVNKLAQCNILDMKIESRDHSILLLLFVCSVINGRIYVKKRKTPLSDFRLFIEMIWQIQF